MFSFLSEEKEEERDGDYSQMSESHKNSLLKEFVSMIYYFLYASCQTAITKPIGEKEGEAVKTKQNKNLFPLTDKNPFQFVLLLDNNSQIIVINYSIRIDSKYYHVLWAIVRSIPTLHRIQIHAMDCIFA